MTSEDDESHSSAAEDDDEEEENKSPPDEGRKRGTASTNLEAEAPKRGKRALADNSAWDIDNSPERPPRTKPRAASKVPKNLCTSMSQLHGAWGPAGSGPAGHWSGLAGIGRWGVGAREEPGAATRAAAVAVAGDGESRGPRRDTGRSAEVSWASGQGRRMSAGHQQAQRGQRGRAMGWPGRGRPWARPAGRAGLRAPGRGRPPERPRERGHARSPVRRRRWPRATASVGGRGGAAEEAARGGRGTGGRQSAGEAEAGRMGRRAGDHEVSRQKQEMAISGEMQCRRRVMRRVGTDRGSGGAWGPAGSGPAGHWSGLAGIGRWGVGAREEPGAATRAVAGAVAGDGESRGPRRGAGCSAEVSRASGQGRHTSAGHQQAQRGKRGRAMGWPGVVTRPNGHGRGDAPGRRCGAGGGRWQLRVWEGVVARQRRRRGAAAF
nr:spidroin-2-like [Aegilops tauschii subsp. strangulata]